MPVGIIYGKSNNKPFSSVVLTYDDSLTLNTEGLLKRYDKIKWIEEEKDSIRITNGSNINVKAKIFSSVHEKQGPLRKARSFKYATFSGSIYNNGIIEESGRY